LCRCLRLCAILFSIVLSSNSFALEPEEVLGEYWKDPLFGVAAAESTHRVEVLYQLLYPELIKTISGQKMRFIFENKSDEVHVFLFSSSPDELQEDQTFQAFVADEVHHATMKSHSGEGHNHTESSSAKDTKSIVSVLEDRPTMTIEPWDTREIILRFDQAGVVYLRCILDGHEDHNHNSVIEVTPADFLLEHHH